MLACLFELAALVLDFIEQPHILDGNHSLVGKGRHQLNLFVGERSHRGAVQANTPIGTPSRSSGTPRMVRNPAYSLSFVHRIFRISRTSGI